MMIPKKRIVNPDEVIQMEKEEPKEADKPRVRRPVSEKDRLERMIRMTDMALNPIEDRLERGLSLTKEEHRTMTTHQHTLMKLEMSKAALEAKMQLGTKSNVELALVLRKKGWPDDQILALFNHSRDVEAALS